MGIKIIAGITGSHFNEVGFPAEANDILDQDNFSFRHKKLALKWNVIFLAAGRLAFH